MADVGLDGRHQASRRKDSSFTQRPFAFVRTGDQARVMRMELVAANDNVPAERPHWLALGVAVTLFAVALTLPFVL